MFYDVTQLQHPKGLQLLHTGSGAPPNASECRRSHTAGNHTAGARACRTRTRKRHFARTIEMPGEFSFDSGRFLDQRPLACELARAACAALAQIYRIAKMKVGPTSRNCVLPVSGFLPGFGHSLRAACQPCFDRSWDPADRNATVSGLLPVSCGWINTRTFSRQ